MVLGPFWHQYANAYANQVPLADRDLMGNE